LEGGSCWRGGDGLVDARAVGEARAEEARAEEVRAEEARLDPPVPARRGVEEVGVLAKRLVRPHDPIDVALVPRQRGQGERWQQGHGAALGRGSSSEGARSRC